MGAHSEQGECSESFCGCEVVTQEHVGGEGGHRHDDGDGVQEEAVESGYNGRVPQDRELLVAHLLNTVP